MTRFALAFCAGLILAACSATSNPLTAANMAPSALVASPGGVSSTLGYGTGLVNSCPHDPVQDVRANVHGLGVTINLTPVPNFAVQGYLVTITRVSDKRIVASHVIGEGAYGFDWTDNEHTTFDAAIQTKSCDTLGPAVIVRFTLEEGPAPDVDGPICPWLWES